MFIPAHEFILRFSKKLIIYYLGTGSLKYKNVSYFDLILHD
ncbi:hypothetical protein P20429_0794 [Pseudoalteromonas sp. BSi20429]|nr:hypothetical protein P20429_0794 [Pseudoalteromonas sp. BSi20429]